MIARYQNLLWEYLVIGGMPGVVDAFLRSGSYQVAHEEQGEILRACEDDMDKYASNADKPKIRRLYNSIPRHLAKEYTKFQYSKIECGGSARKYGNAIDWLIDAGLVCAVPNVSLPTLPLAAYKTPEELKIYVSDAGLLTCMFGFETQAALAKNTLADPAKGGIYENLVFGMLHKRGIAPRHFKRRDNTQEIEFLAERDRAAVPVEVKSSRGATTSLNSFIDQYRPHVAYKLTSSSMGRECLKRTVHHFMAVFL